MTGLCYAVMVRCKIDATLMLLAVHELWGGRFRIATMFAHRIALLVVLHLIVNYHIVRRSAAAKLGAFHSREAPEAVWLHVRGCTSYSRFGISNSAGLESR